MQRQASSIVNITGMQAVSAARAAHVICPHVLRLGTTHKAVAEVGIVDRVLREEIPAEVFVVAHAFLRGVWACVSHMPNVPRKALFVHGLANAAVPHVAHPREYIPIELAYAPQLVTFDLEAAVGGALLQRATACVRLRVWLAKQRATACM